MAKALRTAAFVVGAVALVATGIGAAGGAGLLGSAIASGGTIAGVGTAAAFSSFGTLAGVGAGVLSLASAVATPRASLGGNPTEFTIDKESGIPYAIGRTYSAGKVVHRQYYGSKNSLESWVAVHSLGPIKSLGAFQVEKKTVTFAGGAAQGTYAGYMWLDQQLGACPEARALQGPQGDFPGWTSASKLSGLAADLWTLKFDSKGKKYPNGVPVRGRIVEGVFVYDPRLDSTYPGGSGPCRLGQEATYVYSEIPALHAITWAYGRVQNGTLVAGGGMKVVGIDLAPFVEWANVCEANSWKAGGIVYTSADNDWDTLKMICQAGGAEPMPVGGQLSVTFNAPRVSIGTITSADIIGDVDVPGTASRRARRNTVIPRVRLESHGWEVVPLNAIAIPDYVALDGGSRPKEITFPLVQQVDQGAQLGLYEILNGRELDGILLPCKATMIGYRPGDCLTVDIPEAALVGREVVVRNREIDMATVGVTFTCRSETASKHSFALGHGGMAPPTPDLSIPELDLSAPDAGDWTANGAVLSANGVSFPAVIVTGSADDRPLAGVLFEYRPYTAGADPDVGWSGGGLDGPGITRKEITSVTSDTEYEVAVRYMVGGTYSDRLVLGPVTAGVFSASGGAQAAIATSFPIGLTMSAADTGVVTISAHIRRYTDGHPDVAVEGATIATGLAPGAFRAIGYDDADRVGGAVSYQLFEDDIDARAAPDHPARHYLGYAIIPTAGSPPSSGGGATPPGGQCVTTDTPILMADGTERPAGDILVGDRILTRHELRLNEVGGGWGVFLVEAIEIADSEDVWQAEVGGRTLRATGEHLVYTGAWVKMRDIGTKVVGSHRIVKMTVTDAHTYVSNGVLSHNIKMEPREVVTE
ncbi:Hint domain-containing protein [Sphingomonas sp. ACRSK]|uniref:Hint domain-containing protein n=1 Tax=Sphingomonas sp. ACRSK TaxID=2918213 RepID=UPI001EF750A4|nr:Hint domain-containing protein [Sphingomonas sp. ACRSK]MCG7349799.1 Hint domain-containing protein [Sphingomonas sp. ACRSK]